MCQGEGREVSRVQSTGRVALNLNVVTKGACTVTFTCVNAVNAEYLFVDMHYILFVSVYYILDMHRLFLKALT